MFPGPAFLSPFAECIAEDSEQFIQHPHFAAQHQAHFSKRQGTGVDAANDSGEPVAEFEGAVGDVAGSENIF